MLCGRQVFPVPRSARFTPPAPRSENSRPYPDVAEWADYFLHAKASDADALAVMAPRDGRMQAARTQ